MIGRGNPIIERFGFSLPAAACALLALCGTVVAATKNIDVVVTHGNGSLTTYTVTETSGKNQPAGMVYIAGQAFRRGDLPPGTYPVFRDPTTKLPLPVQQLDEIATRRENGDDGSIRHLVFSVQLPAIPANGTYTMEIVRQTGSYSATAKQSLAALAKAHDLKLHLTDVRNQDGSTRGSGSLTFDIDTAASNTGRDAPRPCASGPVRDCWIVVGPPIDDTTHKPDPLLYVMCYLDLTTATDGVSLGPVRHVCRVDNPWENVASGSPGNPGNPGPAGFANDPQAISYRPQLLDGASNLLDWSWLDATIDTSVNPINLSTSEWTIPGSVGTSEWPFGEPVVYSTTGTPPSGMTNGKLYFACNCEGAGTPNNRGTKISFYNIPSIFGGTLTTTSDQGSAGAVNKFSYRVWHTHWQSWLTVAQNGKENWTNGTARAESPFYPAFTDAEKIYWEQTGAIYPVDIHQVFNAQALNTGNYLSFNVNPMSRIATIGGSGGGNRPELGIISDWASQAWLLNTPTAWDQMREFETTGLTFQMPVVLNEATGRIPVLNNGPPGGALGNGQGGSYSELGAPQPYACICRASIGNAVGVIPPLEGVPVASFSGYHGGYFGNTVDGMNHYPAYFKYSYLIFGSRHLLDAMYTLGDHSEFVSPNVEQERGGHVFTVPGAATFYGISIPNAEPRGGFLSWRDKIYPAAFGGDSNIERAYFADMLKEQGSFWQAFKAWEDTRRPNFSTAAMYPGEFFDSGTFEHNYIFGPAYLAWVEMRDPFANYVIGKTSAIQTLQWGDSVPNALSSYYGGPYYSIGSLKTCTTQTDSSFVTDGSEYGQISWAMTYNGANGSITVNGGSYDLNNGGFIKDTSWCTGGGGYNTPPDQLNSNTWYAITNANQATQTFQVINPATGMPFTTWTKGGVTYNYQSGEIKWRGNAPASTPSLSPGSTYYYWDIQMLAGLKILGYSAINQSYNNYLARIGGSYQYPLDKTPTTWHVWNPNVVVP